MRVQVPVYSFLKDLGIRLPSETTPPRGKTEIRGLMRRINAFIALVGLTVFAITALGAGSAHAAYTASNDLGTSATLISTSVSPIASSQTTSIIAGNIGSALGGGFGGGGFGGGLGGAGPITSLPDNGDGALSASLNADPASSSQTYLNTREMVGRAAGGKEVRFGAWIQGSYTWIDNTQSGGEFDGNVTNILAGLDYKANDRMVIGVSAGYENTDIDTTFNRGTFEGDGLSVAPYLGLNLTPNWSASASIGYSDLSYDSRNGTLGRTGSFDAERWFGSVGLDGNYRFNKVRISPTIGVLYMEESQDSYTDSAGGFVASQKIKLGRISAGGTVGYLMGRVEPYAKLVGEYDFERPDAVTLGNGQLSHNDDMGAIVGVGMNIQLTDTMTGNVEGSYNTLGREDIDVYATKARLQWTF